MTASDSRVVCSVNWVENPRSISELTNHDIINLIGYVERERFDDQQKSFFVNFSHLAHFYSEDVALDTVKTVLRQRSPELNYEHGPFVLEQGVLESLYHRRPVTLVQTIKFQDPSYIRFIQRHFGLPMTGNVQDLYNDYAIHRYQAISIPKPDGLFDFKIGVKNMLLKLLYDPEHFLEYARSYCTPALIEELRADGDDGIERRFIARIIPDSAPSFVLGKLAASGNLPLLKYAFELCYPFGINPENNDILLKVLCKSFRYTNPTYTRKCYQLFRSRGFKIFNLNQNQLIRLVEIASRTGNVPFTEYVMIWIRRETSFPDLRAILGLDSCSAPSLEMISSTWSDITNLYVAIIPILRPKSRNDQLHPRPFVSFELPIP